MQPEDDLPVKATQTSARVLDALVDAESATLADLVDQLDHSKSSVHDHLSTLEGLGLIVKDGRTYRIGLRFLELGAGARERFPLYQAGRSSARKLSNASRLSASLFVLEDERLICLFTAPATGVEDPAIDAGDVLPLHCTAPGKAILAEHDPESVTALLEASELTAHTENTITETAELRESLEGIRSEGWAADREECQPGVRGIATTVTDTGGTLHGALSVTGDADSLSGKRFEQDVPGMLISSANEIQTTLAQQS